MALDKGDFLGREALLKVKAEGAARRLCSFSIAGFAPLHGGEAIVCDGRVVGSTSSAGYGHTLGRTIALGYLPVAALSASAGANAFSIEAFGSSYPASRGPRCLYDPKMDRLRA